MPSRFLHRRRILFHETDLAGIVHFSNFFKYMEEAEHAFLRSVGLSIHPEENWRSPVRHGWPRVRAACDFHMPLQFEEEIEIELQVAEIRTRSIRYRCLIWKDPDGRRLRAATGELVVVSVVADRAAGTIQSAPLPPTFRERLQPHPEAGGLNAARDDGAADTASPDTAVPCDQPSGDPPVQDTAG